MPVRAGGGVRIHKVSCIFRKIRALWLNSGLCRAASRQHTSAPQLLETEMLQLLREHQVAPSFRRARKQSSEAVVAVPFWGNGAASALGLTENDPVRILCNLDHPGCNPDAIDELRGLRIKVRTHPRLHAKLYATKQVAIVGSSNVSTNGLTVEGAASKGWIEANVCSDDPTLVADALALFETIWEDPETRPVRKLDIEAARKTRANWRMPVAVPGKKTLFAACRERPDDFRSVYVAAYDEGLGDNGRRQLREVKDRALPPKPGMSTSDFRKAWGYQFEDIPEGAWLIGLNCRRPNQPRYVGCAKATGLRLTVDGETDLTIAIPGVVEAPGSGARLRVSAAEKASLVMNATRILDRNTLLPLPDAIKIIDRSR